MLSVMTFNVLASLFEMRDHLPNHMPFAVRFPKVLSLINSHDCDIVLLNECEPLRPYASAMVDRYHLIHFDKSVILAKKRTIRLHGHHQVFRESPRSPHFLLATLCEHLPTGHHFTASTMHMKADGVDRQKGNADVSMCHLRIQHLRAIIPQLMGWSRSTTRSPPLIFGGDFNCRPTDATMGYLLSRANMPVSLFSAIAESRGGLEPPFTCLDSSYGTPWHATLDYILAERGKFEVNCLLSVLPTLQDYGNADAVPFTGSDHIPLAVELQFT